MESMNVAGTKEKTCGQDGGVADVDAVVKVVLGALVVGRLPFGKCS